MVKVLLVGALAWLMCLQSAFAGPTLMFNMEDGHVLYADDPDYANIVMLNLKVNRNFLKTEAYGIIQSSAKKYIQVIKEGIQNGVFRSDIDPHLVRSMIWGTIQHSVTRRSMMGEPDDLMALADDIYDTIFAGIRAKKNEPAINVNVMMQNSD